MPGQSGKIVATFISSEHEPGGGERLVDVERPHRRPDREQLETSSRGTGASAAIAAGTGARMHAEPVPRHRRRAAAPRRASSSTRAGGGGARSRRRTRRARSRRDRDRRGSSAPSCGIFAVEQHVDDEQHHRERGRRRGARRPCRRASPTLAAPLLRQAPREHGDARELADAAGQHGVREEADAERREDERKRGCGGGIACSITGRHASARTSDREQVEPDRRDDPLPVDDRERVGDERPSPARATRAARPTPRAPGARARIAPSVAPQQPHCGDCAVGTPASVS